MQPKLRFPLLILAAALLALPASATASSKSAIGTTATDFGVASATAKCKKGQRATGGGFSLTPSVSARFLDPIESRKVGQRKWRVSAQLNGSPASVSAKAIVYCAEDAPHTTAISAGASIPSNSLGRATASCGSAGKAQAGGFSLPPGSSGGRVGLESFRLDKKSWRSSATATDGAVLTSFVYCARTGAPRSRSGSATASADRAPATALSAPCGVKPVAGGFSQPDAFIAGFAFAAFVPYESVRSGKRWRTSGIHDTSPPFSTTLNSFAYCP
jgi:hypothetical protein